MAAMTSIFRNSPSPITSPDSSKASPVRKQKVSFINQHQVPLSIPIKTFFAYKVLGFEESCGTSLKASHW